ncbi:unnamed protein product [Paramecium pentaurelia]|uniref:Uncharacterized protein n=1 Tax=Paramecium pentaurelia TaxID=43138 RepID=A0A8S1XNE1_9CILI|nr:unnamed protein product [Paramecium pentaurelia]
MNLELFKNQMKRKQIEFKIQIKYQRAEELIIQKNPLIKLKVKFNYQNKKLLPLNLLNKDCSKVLGFNQLSNKHQTNGGLEFLKFAPENPPIKKLRQKIFHIIDEPQELQQIEQFDNKPESIVLLEQHHPQPQYNNKIIYQQAASVSKQEMKKNNLDELIDKKDLMVTDDINYSLKKDLLIYPITVYFWDIKQNRRYEYKINVKNEDILAKRIVFKQPLNTKIKELMKQMGSLNIFNIQFFRSLQDQSEKSLFKYKPINQANFLMNSKSCLSIQFIQFQQINGNVLEPTIFDKLDSKQVKLSSKPILKKQVKDLLSQLKQQNNIGDSQVSDLLPKINYDKNYKIDPFQSQKKEDQSYEDEN